MLPLTTKGLHYPLSKKIFVEYSHHGKDLSAKIPNCVICEFEYVNVIPTDPIVIGIDSGHLIIKIHDTENADIQSVYNLSLLRAPPAC